MMGDKERLVAERDHWIRLFNRMEAAVAHHRAANDQMLGTTLEADEALYHARDRIVADAAKPMPMPVDRVDYETNDVAGAAWFERNRNE